AMAHGKVVITTTIGAEGIPVISGEHLLIADNPEVFAKYIMDLIGQSEKLETLSRNAVDFVQRVFDNETIARRVSDFYHQLLQAKG
ncbi:MAG TPA: hypothetical protein PLF75_13000, partial [Bacteroidales bacterium]|nr:hypothetical protein [Bacteroidales bacterium]